jgi:hypothetical protein
LAVRVRAEQNFPQTLAGEKSGLRALQLYLFQLLTAFAFEFAIRE